MKASKASCRDTFGSTKGLKRQAFQHIRFFLSILQGLEALKPLTHLVRLDLSETRVTGPGLASLSRFGEPSDSSADLSLARTPIQDEALAHLQNWRWLQHLDLSHTKITDRGLAFLEAMGPMLSRVDIGGTEVTDQGVERLKSSHPGLSINR